MEIQKTERGFEFTSFEDKSGDKCSIQKSSSAMEDCIWMGVDSSNPRIMARDAIKLGLPTNATTGWIPYHIPKEVCVSTRMHLTREMVRNILPVLRRFADTGEVYELPKDENPPENKVYMRLLPDKEGNLSRWLFGNLPDFPDMADEMAYPVSIEDHGDTVHLVIRKDSGADPIGEERIGLDAETIMMMMGAKSTYSPQAVEVIDTVSMMLANKDSYSSDDIFDVLYENNDILSPTMKVEIEAAARRMGNGF